MLIRNYTKNTMSIFENLKIAKKRNLDAGFFSRLLFILVSAGHHHRIIPARRPVSRLVPSDRLGCPTE